MQKNLVTLVPILLLLSGCAANTDVSCLAFEPIIYPAATTPDDVVRQIDAHNAAWDSLCT